MLNTSETGSSAAFRVIALAALVLLIVALASPVDAQSPAPVRVGPDPLTLGLRAGEQGVVSIRAEGAAGLYGAEVHLTFDPAVLEVLDADAAAAGCQVKPGDWLKEGFVAVNKVDNALGKIDFAVTLLNPAPAVSGSGNLATVTFRARANGNSPLKITSALLASKEASEIKSAWQDGSAAVSAGGLAPAAPPSAAAPPKGVASAIDGAAAKPSQAILTAVAGAAVLFFMAAAVLVIVVVKRRA